MPHDFVNFPELTNGQMQIYYFESPHKQILESFTGTCVRVVDGDTIMVKMSERDFDFPVRFNNINAPEMSEGGKDSKQWLKNRLEGQSIDVLVDPKNRVGKYGRLLGTILHGGMSVGQEMIQLGKANIFGKDKAAQIPDLRKVVPNLSKIIPRQ